jgi:hypothetical protein
VWPCDEVELNWFARTLIETAACRGHIRAKVKKALGACLSEWKDARRRIENLLFKRVLNLEYGNGRALHF